MNPKPEKYVIAFLFVVLLFVGLNGCTKKQPETTVSNEPPLLGNAQSIADALGCMFAQKCESKNKNKDIKKDVHVDTEEQQEQITKEFDQMDEDVKNAK